MGDMGFNEESTRTELSGTPGQREWELDASEPRNRYEGHDMLQEGMRVGK
jgi:hypothetical protein